MERGKRMIKILMTAFDAFGGDTVNAARETVLEVSAPAEDIELIRLELPTIFGRSVELLTRAMETHKPDAVVCVGQASGRAAVKVERVAVNIMDAVIPDNAGYQPVDEPIEANGPAAYFATLPVKQIAEAINRRGVAADVSNTAGTYVCNQLMYGGLHYAASHFPQMQVGFIHVPNFTGQGGEDRQGQTAAPQAAKPSMEREKIVLALETVLETVAAGIRQQRGTEETDIDALVAMLDRYTGAEGSRMKINVVEGEGKVLSRQYHHGRCDVGSPWARGEAFDVLE